MILIIEKEMKIDLSFFHFVKDILSPITSVLRFVFLRHVWVVETKLNPYRENLKSFILYH